MDNTIAILILAAGQSSRMGQPKQLLPWKKTTLLGQAIDTAKQLSESVYVVLGANFKVIATSIINEPVSIIHHEDWSNGLGSSIAKGVAQIPLKKYAGVLIMLADQPLLSVLDYKNIIQTFKANPCKIVASQYEIKIGVPALFSWELSAELLELHQDFGANRIIKKYPLELINIKPKESTVDIDTPEEYHTFKPKSNQQ